MKKILLITTVAVIAIATGYIYKHPDQTSLSNLLSHQSLSSAEQYLPAPLRAAIESQQAYLTVSGVLQWTNVQRTDNTVPVLKHNQQLDAMAQRKLADMFEKQYFEHISPQGVGPANLADKVGYQYVVVGENLALGNFKDDKTLVEAWMNSPGHRANILNKQFTEIGIAVGKGMFEGKQTWLAVQSFGRPLSSCPAVDGTIKSQITQNNTQIKDLQIELERLKTELEASRNDPPTYNQKVSVYNQKVNQVNQLIAETKALVSQYNGQVDSFNNCIKGE